MSQDAPSERFRIVQEHNSKRIVVETDISDVVRAHDRLAQYRALAPRGLSTHLERQDTTPRPWERLNA